MKNKKIISLICALSMIFTVFASFTVVNAADKGIKLEQSISKDNKTITLNAIAVGETGFNNFAVVVNVPENVTMDNIDATSSNVTLGLVNLTDDHILYVTFTDMTGKGVDIADGKLATIKITLPEALADDFEFKLQDDAGFENKAGEAIDVAGGMDPSAVTVVPEGKPTPKPTAAARPGKEDEPETPDVPTPVVPTDKGIKLTSSVDKAGKVITIDATAVGETGFNNFAVVMNVPENVTMDNIDATSSNVTLGLVNLTDDHILYVTFTDMTGKGVDIADGKLATIKITLPEALTEPFVFKLQNDAGFENKAGVAMDVAGGMTAASAVVDPTAGEEVKPVATLALKDYVDASYEAAIAAVPAGKAVYMTVDVKKGNANATYGSDYVAVYDDKELTEVEFNNLIHGYTEPDMVKVIKGVKFNLFNKDITKILTTLNAEDQETQLVMPTDKDVTYGKPVATQKPVELSLKAELSAKTINPNNAVKVNATVTSGDDVKVEAGDIVQFLIAKGDKYVEFNLDDETEVQVGGKSYTAYEKAITKVDNGAATVSARVAALDKTGSTNIIVNYYKAGAKTTDTAETETEEAVLADKPVDTATVAFKVTAVKGNGGGSGSGSDSDGKGGPISQGSGVIGAQTGAINFVDLDTVTWAQDAILRLVDKRVINGRSNTIFDPNGTVTRAEFAKMVVLGFGLVGGTSGNFSDVDTTAWYNTYVQIGYANDVISGYDDGTFRPNGLISRQEMAAMISRAVKAANKNLPATVAAVDFTDVNPTTEWGYAEISALQTAGVINGMTATTYEPYSNATRAQAAVIIDRAMTNAK